MASVGAPGYQGCGYIRITRLIRRPKGSKTESIAGRRERAWRGGQIKNRRPVGVARFLD